MLFKEKLRSSLINTFIVTALIFIFFLAYSDSAYALAVIGAGVFYIGFEIEKSRKGVKEW